MKEHVPLRVDFAGGWLDVPELAREEGYIVNCAISPLVSLEHWPYAMKSGLGGSGAWAVLNQKDGVAEEIKNGAGWQDPAIIQETGLCSWRSGEKPSLEIKRNPVMLEGRMALWWSGVEHNTPSIKTKERDYDAIVKASQLANRAIQNTDFALLATAVHASYQIQLKERMLPLPSLQNELAKKYCGSGHGGYAVYIYPDKNHRDFAVKKTHNMIAIEPYLREENKHSIHK